MAERRNRDPQCAVQTILPLVMTLRDRGVDPEPLLAEVGIRAADLVDPDFRLPVAHSWRLLDAALEATGDPSFPLQVAERIQPEGIGIFAYLAAACDTPRVAFERTARYLRLMNEEVDLELIVEGPRTICTFRMQEREVPVASAEITIGIMVRIGRLVMGGSDASEAWFRHPEPRHVDAYHRVLGVPLRFEAPYNALVGRSDRLDTRLPRADSALSRFLESQAEALLRRLPSREWFSARVRGHITRSLPSGNPNADAVAEALGTSARTLRRRLRDEGTTHQQVLDEVRSELAERYLRERLTVMEVAFLLGFSDASSFHKAFRRWTGRSPGEVLRQSA